MATNELNMKSFKRSPFFVMIIKNVRTEDQFLGTSFRSLKRLCPRGYLGFSWTLLNALAAGLGLFIAHALGLATFACNINIQ
jgi:hypothetical protein